uniref:DUF6729 domain-containing protein n=1 Tax=Knipowitschia caucasica TaxID=637954 RepID=A0AAV2MR41_KNICA
MGPTEEANRSEIVVAGRARCKEEVLAEATAFVRQNGGNPGDQSLVLAHCKIQFGKHQGQRFLWLLENSLGYAMYLVSSIMGEEERDNPLSANKHLFLRYTSQIRREAVEVYQKKQAMLQDAQRTGDSGCLMVEFGDFKGRSMKEVYEDPSKEAQSLITYLRKSKARPNTNMALFKAYVLKRQAPAHLPTTTMPAASAPSAAVPTATVFVPPPPAATQSRPLLVGNVKALLARGKHLSASQLAQKILSPAKPSVGPRCHPASEPAARRQLFTCDSAAGDFLEEEDDEEMATVASQAEEQLPQATAASRGPALAPPRAPALAPPRVPGPAAAPAPPELWTTSQVSHLPAELPVHWKEQLPSFQQDWIRKTLFRANTRTGKPELTPHPNFWWYPPQPPTVFTQPPASPDIFFCRPLFLWMPLKMWSIPLVCVQPACSNHKLTAAGIYRTVRKVLDIDGWYDMATEYLECKGCKKYPAWSEDILGQLDMGHRRKFPAILTYRYSCDYRVVIMMRERTRGNSVTQLHKKLQEQHTSAWSQRTLEYLTVCEPFTDSSIIEPPVFSAPPPLPPIPKPKWLLSVYARDVLSRLPEVKAKITSVFGSVLKMDSTKKVTKKLAGAAANTAGWCSNVGNEHGQVLVSVLTAAEGHGLWPMAAGLMKRYREAGVAPPAIMYVDRDCCSPHAHGQSQVRAMFAEWDELQVRLDIWHFMRRFAAGVITEAHQLYGTFMTRLSRCIFELDPEDVAALRLAKQGELQARGAGPVSEKALDKLITRKELSLHCRKRTRGVEETTRRIRALIEEMDSEKGRDTLGVPLLDHERIQQVWIDQQRHIACIQDPEGFPLYQKTGTLKKGGVELRCYRCARGSTSLESFHLHLNRFIPGTSASDAHFQAYLLEGLMRWNQDRMDEAVGGKTDLRTYSSAEREAMDRLSRKVLKTSLDEHYQPPGAYTGELLGMEYLYSQSGKSLSVMDNPEEEDRLVEQKDDEVVQDEGFVEEEPEDLTVPVLYDAIETVPVHSSGSQAFNPSLRTGTILTAPPLQSPQLRPAQPPLQSPPQPSAQPSAASGPATSTGSSVADQAPAPVLGPSGVAGWDKVQDLAEYLVSLRQALYLDEQQVTEVIRLWTALPDGDKRRIHYQPRHQPKLTHGRFKPPKNTGVTPGVDSVKRCLIGHPGGPAQWPSTSRLVEAMCIKLCALHKSPTKKDGVRLPRWTKVLNDYHHIRDLVLNCHTLMEATSLQLFVLNQRTLTQWFNRRENTQEVTVLSQGLAAEDRLAVASSQLPAPRESLDEAPSTSGARHEFVLPPNRAGQAPKLRPGKRPASATVVRPITPAAPLPLVPAPLPQFFVLQVALQLLLSWLQLLCFLPRPRLLLPLPQCLCPASRRETDDAGQKRRPVELTKDDMSVKRHLTNAPSVASPKQRSSATAGLAVPPFAPVSLVANL